MLRESVTREQDIILAFELDEGQNLVARVTRADLGELQPH